MSLKNRVGFFFIFFGSLALLVFWASLQAPKPSPDLLALLVSAASLLLGWALATSKSRAQPPYEEPPPPPPPPPAPQKKRGLAGLFQRPPPAPPPAPPPPPPAEKKKRRGLFRSRPD